MAIWPTSQPSTAAASADVRAGTSYSTMRVAIPATVERVLDALGGCRQRALVIGLDELELDVVEPEGTLALHHRADLDALGVGGHRQRDGVALPAGRALDGRVGHEVVARRGDAVREHESVSTAPFRRVARPQPAGEAARPCPRCGAASIDCAIAPYGSGPMLSMRRLRAPPCGFAVSTTKRYETGPACWNVNQPSGSLLRRPGRGRFEAGIDDRHAFARRPAADGVAGPATGARRCDAQAREKRGERGSGPNAAATSCPSVIAPCSPSRRAACTSRAGPACSAAWAAARPRGGARSRRRRR